jgi:hypothetical protein
MTRTPKTPAASALAPVASRRAAQATPGRPAASPPRAAGGKLSRPVVPDPAPGGAPASLSRPAVATGTAPAPGMEGPCKTSSVPGRGPKTPAGGGQRRATGAPLAGSQAYLDDYTARKMSEAELEIHVRALIKDLGLLGYHTRDSRGSAHGFPDWVIVGRSVIYRELKTAKGRVTDSQAEWLHALVRAEQDACVWRPADLLSGLIGRQLAKLAGWAVTA